MKIENSKFLCQNFISQNNEPKSYIDTRTPKITKTVGLRSQFNDHRISFGERVEKDLPSFYERNKQNMPKTVKEFVESLEDMDEYTPLEAQYFAFEKLEDAKTIEDIKTNYPDEPLFKFLMNPEQTHATRGIISCFNGNKELLEISDEGALKDKTNLTVYLLKKVFLEAKTIDEINKDLENDLNEDLKADFKYKNPNSKYIYGSTLHALGIQTPSAKYQQSLRYTRDGYSDLVGNKISGALKDFINSLSDEDRTARAKKSVLRFENWWQQLSRNEKLELIAEEENILAMLKSYKKITRKREKQEKAENPNIESAQSTEEKHKPIKVGSQVLSQDELFKKWATNNLRLFEARMSEADKDTIHIRRMQNLVHRWASMSAAERTDYIEKMKAGSAPLRFAMIDAWNNSIDIIKDLSTHLRNNQIYKTADLLYSSELFSEYQSKVMTEFWDTHPEYAIKLGERITASNQKIDLAIKRGYFEELKKEINRDKKQRIKEIAAFKTKRDSGETEITKSEAEEPQYKKEFKKAYDEHIYGKLKSIPTSFYNDSYTNVLNDLPQDIVELWTKNLKGEPIDKETMELLKSYLHKESPATARCNRALEAAMADTLFEITGDAEVYTLSSSDVKTAMYHAERGEYPIRIYSHKNKKNYFLRPLPNKRNKKPDANRINLLYTKYKEDLPEEEISDIIRYYFKDNKMEMIRKLSSQSYDPESSEGIGSLTAMILSQYKKIYDELKSYINTYGKSALILFSNRSAYPNSVKKEFNKKFMGNMPEPLKEQKLLTLLFSDPDKIEQEQLVNKACYLFANRFNFVPQEYMSSYKKEMASVVRLESVDKIEHLIESVCTKRKHTGYNKQIAVIPKRNFSMENKLKTLAMEQALADVLYEATGCEDVYHMNFEMLCDNIEIFNLVKKFPSEERNYATQGSDKNIVIKANFKPKTHKVIKLYRQYLSDVVDWTKEVGQNPNNVDLVDLVCILNPDETNHQRDLNIAKRMKSYGFDVNLKLDDNV